MGNFPLAPPQASEFAHQIDPLFYALTAVCVFFGGITFLVVIYFSLRYKRGTKADRSNPKHEHLPLEISWSIFPLILALVFFWFGAKQFIYAKTPPKDAMEIYVVGKQWMWHIQHAESGVRENNTLHVPIGRPVKLTMISQDVLHAFYIPEFRIQYHVVPGRYTQSWFTATKPGTYHLFCAMYCGTQHSEMGGYVYAMKPDDYAQWIKNGGNDPQPQTLVERGGSIYTKMACEGCHTEKDTIHGPSLYSLYGKTRRFTDGTTAVADDAYIRESIYKPDAKIVAGYIDTMSPYVSGTQPGAISEEDMLALVAYIKTLGTTNMPLDKSLSGTQRGVTPNSKVPGSARVTAVGALGFEKDNPEANRLRNGKPAVGALGSEN
ncbi:MAG TPA: cytochrome c oxidase subunit II [Fimbriimonadaceae bacterium]|nr:cytochrome c oxidase subunit II [Fimbriimonadaceae bacterium]